MGGAPCDINRNGICENDFNQGKAHIWFLGAKGSHLEKTDKVRWTTLVIAGHTWVLIYLLLKWVNGGGGIYP